MPYRNKQLSRNQRRFFKTLIHGRVIAVDFDGTLSLGEFPQCGPANDKLIDLLKTALSAPLDERPYYVLWTCRRGVHLENAVKWCRRKGLFFDGINHAPSETRYTRKLWADLYIDDKSITPEMFIASHEVDDSAGKENNE